MKPSPKSRNKLHKKPGSASANVLPPLNPLLRGEPPPQLNLQQQAPPAFPSLGGAALPSNGQVNLQAMGRYTQALAKKLKTDPQVGRALASMKKAFTRELRLNPGAVNQPEVLAETAKQLLQNQSFLSSMQTAINQVGPGKTYF